MTTFSKYHSNVNAVAVGYAKSNHSSSYNVVFNNNGGSGTMANQPISYGSSAVLSSNTFTKTGFYFGGWNTSAEGSGTSYADGATITISSALANDTLTLYAIWYDKAVEINGVYYCNM